VPLYYSAIVFQPAIRNLSSRRVRLRPWCRWKLFDIRRISYNHSDIGSTSHRSPADSTWVFVVHSAQVLTWRSLMRPSVTWVSLFLMTTQIIVSFQLSLYISFVFDCIKRYRLLCGHRFSVPESQVHPKPTELWWFRSLRWQQWRISDLPSKYVSEKKLEIWFEKDL